MREIGDCAVAMGGGIRSRREARTTSTYAGKTLRGGLVSFRWWDHPRVCGENVGLLLRSVDGDWTTPAYAGKIERQPQHHQSGRDHPRVCGENRSSISCSWGGVGPPPRMRGKLPDMPEEEVEQRTTPAYAGKTAPRPAYRPLGRDHPRVCGENAFACSFVLRV